MLACGYDSTLAFSINAVLVIDDGVQSPAAAGLGVEENPDIPGMRQQIHSESPIISNLTLRLDIAKGSASCGIAVGEVGEMDDNVTIQCVSIVTMLSRQCRTAVLTNYSLGICRDTN